MSLTLHAVTIPSYLQILGSLARLVGKAEAHCAAQGLEPAELIQARLAPDMLPFAYQVKSATVHSAGAIEGVRKGLFAPDTGPSPDTFAGLKARLDAAVVVLQAVDPAELETYVGRDMRFEFGERRMDFTAEEFLLSFSQPNFYFHATTAYDILRWKGLPIGKRDYTGRVRVKA
jgi:hypothetical protein